MAKLNDTNRQLRAANQRYQDTVRTTAQAEQGARRALLATQGDVTRLEKQIEDAGLTPVTRLRKP
jgi:hypothetical protein